MYTMTLYTLRTCCYIVVRVLVSQSHKTTGQIESGTETVTDSKSVSTVGRAERRGARAHPHTVGFNS